MDAEAYRQKLEKDILVIIAEKLQNGQMDTERAQAIARMVLDKLHPPLTLEQIYAIAPTLDDHFTELAQAVLPIVKEHEKKLDTIVAEHAAKLIQSGRFEQADIILKHVLHSDTHLE